MRNINADPENNLALDFEENLEGFIRFLNWLSVIPYVPAIAALAGMTAGVLLGLVRLRSAGRIFVVVFALNWMSLRWLEHRFLSSPNAQGRHAA